MTNIRYEDGSGMRGPSTFWAELEPWHGINPNDGWGEYEDFGQLLVSGTDKIVLEEADDNAAWSNVTTEECGVMRLTASDANEEGSMQFGKLNTYARCCIDAGYGRCWFEGRIRTSSVTTGRSAFIFGLAEEGFAASNCVTDAGAANAIADKDFVGFGVWADAGTEIDAFYHTASATAVTHKANIGTLAADTWVKLGLYFDGFSQIWFYVDGVRYGTAALESATGFPDGEELSPVFAIKNVQGTSTTYDIDWWAFAQEAIPGTNC